MRINKQYKRKVNNKLGWYGDTDIKKKIIQVNKKRSKNKPTHKRPINKHAHKYPEVLDTIVHEEMHAAHPKKHEKTVRIETRNKLKRMSEIRKKKFYGMYR